VNSLALNALHLLGAGAGVWVILRPAPSRLAFWGKALACCVLMALFLLKVSAPGPVFEDFTDAYWAAGRAVLVGPDALRPLFEQGVSGFVNLPVLAYLFAPFGLLPEKAAAYAFFALGGASVLWAWRLLGQRYAYDDRASALALFALSAFGPLIYSLREGNTSHMLLAVLIWAMGLVAARKDYAAGLAFGFCALIKPPLLLLGIYALARGRWKVVASGAAICVFAALLSVLVFGLDMHLLWIDRFRDFSAEPMAAYNAQSFASFAARLQHGYRHLMDWQPRALAPAFLVVAYALTLTAFLACVLAVRHWRAHAPKEDANEDYGLILILTFICIAATVSWSHYFVWLVPAFAFLAERLRHAPQRPRVALAVAALLTAPGIFRGQFMESGGFEPFTALLASHLLIGGVIVLALLYAWPAPSKEL